MNILFVCTGNTCRSPMAEAIFRDMVGADTYTIQSAGIAAIHGGPASLHAEQVLRDRGLSDAHAAQILDEDLIAWADLILTMTFSHKLYILDRFTDVESKVYALKEFTTADEAYETEALLDWDIADPFGGDYERYVETATEIEQYLQKLHKKLQNEAGKGLQM